MLSNHGIGPNTEKVTAIEEARQPKNSSEVRGFLGLVNYCARFIPGLAAKAEPLRRLTHCSVNFDWTVTEETAFNQIKDSISCSDNYFSY